MTGRSRTRPTRSRPHRVAGSPVGDAAFIANRLSWRAALVFGVAGFTVFYWAVPWWVMHQVATLEGNRFQAVVASVLHRRVHYVQWLGIAVLIVCGTIAAWRYFTGRRLSTEAERGVTFLSRLLGRRLD